MLITPIQNIGAASIIIFDIANFVFIFKVKPFRRREMRLVKHLFLQILYTKENIKSRWCRQLFRILQAGKKGEREFLL